MTRAIEYQTVDAVDFAAFTDAFNLAYSDYWVPVSMTAPAFRALIRRDDLDLSASVVALDGERIVGTGLLGIRGDLGWIGGMGVIPGYRRQGIGRRMMHYLIDTARARGLARIDLEVIEANTGAHALYQQLGFVARRMLLSLERPPGAVKSDGLASDYAVERRDPTDVLQHYDSFHNVPNCWQRALPSLRALTVYVDSWALVHRPDGAVAGYALGWASAESVRLVDFAVSPAGDRRAAASTLLGHLHQRHTNAHGSTYNIAEDDAVLPGFEALGYRTTLRQIEMTLALE